MHPLSGITVVALEQAVAAPFATRQLADLGARVIKVERNGEGDFARHYDDAVKGQSSYFVWLNRGKESIELDIKSPEDRALLDRMIQRSDVFVHNLAPGAVERLRLDAESLRAERPDLIHCSISGYGAEGPYTERKAYDLLVQCETGLLDITGTSDQRAKVGISVADIATGMYAFNGILTALYERLRSGVGAAVEVAMIDALGEWMVQPAYYSAYGGTPPRRTGAQHASIAPYGPYRTSDGSVFLGVQNQREWERLCREVLRRPDLVQDRRFANNRERVVRNDELTSLIESSLATFTSGEAIAALERAGIASAVMRSPRDLLEHPQLRTRSRWRQVDTPCGPVEALLPPVVFHGSEPLMGAVPALGQHNSQLRSEFRADDITG